jgi:hypothetical protein
VSMAGKKSTQTKHVKGLAKDLSKSQKTPWDEHEGEGDVRTSTGGDTGGTAADAGSISPLARLVQLLGEEKIRFQIVAMTAAAMQG